LHSKNYSTSKSLSVSPEKSQILSCDTVVANKRYIICILKYHSELNPNYTYRLLEDLQCLTLSMAVKNVETSWQFYSKTLVQNNLPKVIKSCTVLKQFTVVAVLGNLPPGLSMERFIKL